MLASLLKVASKRIRRFPMHMAIRRLVEWRPSADPATGYTVVIGCMRALTGFALANLQLLQRMDAEDMAEVILVFDCVESEVPDSVREAQRSWTGAANLRVLCYTELQARRAQLVKWGWVYSWMSWCKGISAARTKHVLLHDLDALPLDPTLFRRLYRRALSSGAQFQGIRQYVGQGITPDMNLVTTFELVLDAEHMRSRFKPFAGFNRATLYQSRYVDYDTFLYMQHKSPHRVAEPIDEARLVHPSQMICQFTDFVAGRDDMSRKQHNLLLVPYYDYLGQGSSALDEIGSALASEDSASVDFAGMSLPIGHLEPGHWAWMEKQVRRVEQALHGATRPPVEAFLSGFVSRAMDERTVGCEGGAGVAAR